MAWTEERVEKLKELWSRGLSASQIAKELGGVTRNAVIGKVHRLGLAARGGAQPKAKEAQPAAEEAAPAADGATPAAAAAGPATGEGSAGQTSGAEAVASAASGRADGQDAPATVRDPTQPREPGPPTSEELAARETLAEIEKIARRVSLMELTERVCKWPIGDPTDEDFAFCGLPSVPGKPYCEHHVAIAYQPMSSRRDRVRVGR